jgi:signal transduction histidine kinase/ActR/RegA family two-component response regulator
MAAEETGCILSMHDLDTLGDYLNTGLAEATDEYIKFRDEQLRLQRENLEFLVEAGRLLSSSLDYRSTLTRLTSLIVPRLADWCSVHIEGVGIDATPIAHVDPAKAEALRDMYRRFPLPAEAGYGAPYALRTGEAQLITEMTPEILAAIAQSPEHADIIRSTGFRSGMFLPLRIQGNTFGVLILSYGASGRSYDATDLVFADELARRASIAIDNAKLFEQSLRERSRAEAATRAKDEFVAIVSHELRTPLNAILGWVRLLQGGALPAAKSAHALDVIERNAKAQDRLVADLLDISRIMTGKIRINPSQVDLGNVIEMAVEGLRPAAEAKRIVLDVDYEPGTAVIHGDSDRLEQVVWNLVANAVKFTPKNGRVEVRLRRVESDIELVVLDNGEGIAPSFVPHVFGSFLQSDSSASRPHGGLGLGLSIVKHIVELHGGSVAAESQGVGRGATFRVRLPVGPLISTTVGVSRVPATQADADPPPSVRAPGVKVLLVDDDPDALELVAYLLEGSGMEVRFARSAADALKELETYTPHVIVSDVGMPGEDGYSLIRRIRTLPTAEKKNIPAIALTAFARNEDRARALVEGFNMHMSKPVEPADLITAVASLAGLPTSAPVA